MKININSVLFYILILFSIVLVIFCSIKINSGNDFASADFRYDVNKLTCAALVLKAVEGTESDSMPYASKKDYIKEKDINDELKRVLLKLVNGGTGKMVFTEVIDLLGIKRLDRNAYQRQLRELQFTPLTSDPDLNHYLIVTKGSHAGTIVYNGKKVFKDGNIRYFGLDLIE